MAGPPAIISIKNNKIMNTKEIKRFARKMAREWKASLCVKPVTKYVPEAHVIEVGKINHVDIISNIFESFSCNQEGDRLVFTVSDKPEIVWFYAALLVAGSKFLDELCEEINKNNV